MASNVRTRRKLVFHIGHHKTGSTTIQDAFATGRVSLVDGRIFYPGRMAHNYLKRHFDAFESDGTVLPGATAFPGLGTISERLKKGNFDVAVISGEEFEGSDPGSVQRVMSQFMLPHVNDHAVLCYVRPHAARTLSSFAENVKLGRFAGTPDEYHEKVAATGRFAYAGKVSKWESAFKGHFCLRPMIRAELSGGSVLQDFVEHGFGPDFPVMITPSPAANESLCLEDLILLKLVQDNLALRDRKLRHAMGWQIALGFAAEARADGRGTKLMLHRPLAERMRSCYLADAREMDDRFFGNRNLFRSELDRAVDEALPKAQSFDPADHFTKDMLRAISVMSSQINQLLDHSGEAWPAFLLERRIAWLHGEAQKPAKAKSYPQAGMDGGTAKSTGTPESGLASPGKVLRLETVTRLVAGIHDANKRDVVSRQLGNVLMQTPRRGVQLKAKDFADWLEKNRFPDEVRVILDEFLLHLFFYGFRNSISDATQKQSLSEMVAADGPQGRVLRRLVVHDDYVSDMTRAGIHYLRDDLVEAYDAFDLARQKVQAAGALHHHNRGLLSLRTVPALADWAERESLPDLPAVQMDGSAQFDDDLPLVMIGLDGGYYRRYANRLAETAKGRVNLHFHVANLDEANLLSAPHLRHSFEIAPDASKSYFATMRFLRLPMLLRHYGRPIMTADADALFVGSAMPMFECLAGHDILLNAAIGPNQPRKHLAALPWRKTAAGFLAAAPTPGAMEFLEIFARLYNGLTQENAGQNWWIDQALLAQTNDLCRYQGRGRRIKSLWLHPFSGMRQSKL